MLRKILLLQQRTAQLQLKAEQKQKLALLLVAAAHFGHTEMCDLLFLDKGKSNIEDTNSHL